MKKIQKTGNKGIALVSVLIIITLLSLLAGTVLNLSYLAYSRKLVEKKNNSNFYAAEAVLDSVKTVLQNGAIEALEDAQISEAEFAVSAFKIITGYSGTNVSANGTKASEVCPNAITSVRNYLYNTVISEKVLNEDGSVSTSVHKTDENYVTGGTYTYIKDAITAETSGGNGGEFTIGDIICEEDCVRIEDVYVKYVNDEGYVAEINTDIVIKAPHYIEVGDEPLGSYSMFAGCGVEIRSNAGSTAESLSSTLLYLHQEGNAYFGSMTGVNSKTSLVIGAKATTSGLSDEGGRGDSILSIEGTNVICNGDVRITNGGALFLTGGEGTETAYVQVNGYIVLEEGASLFLAPNVKLCCKGIVTSITYNDDGTVTTVPYTGSEGATATVSQFYPVTDDFIKNYVENNSDYETLLSKYYSGDIDVEQLFSDLGCIDDVTGSALDSRFLSLYVSATSGNYASNVYAGVYVLNVSYDSSIGWGDRTNCYYNLMKCSVGGAWTVNGSNNSQIYCNSSEYDQEEKVTYNGTDYDAEFFNLVNIPLLQLAQNDQNPVFYTVSGYSIEKESTYTTMTWKELKTASAYSSYLNNIVSEWVQSTDDETWSEVVTVTSKVNWDVLDSLSCLTRKFYVPTLNTGESSLISRLVAVDYSGFEIKATVGTSVQTFTTERDYVSFVPPDDFQPNGRSIQFYVTIKKDITVRVNDRGTSSGIVMSSGKVSYGDNTGVMRVISLLELGNKVTSTDGSTVISGLENDGNPVHDLLEYIGSGYINNTDSKEESVECKLVDNMFNGGIAAFWSMSTVSGSSQADDNSGDDLVDYDDWKKQ